WQAIFLVNFPFIISGFALSIFVLPKNGKVKIELKRIDFAGIGLFVTAMAGLILFMLSLAQEIRWWALILFIVPGIMFVFHENRRKDPFIDVKGLKKNKNVTLIYVQFMTINLVYYCYF